MMRIAICDDSEQDAEFVQTLVSNWAQERKLAVSTALFASAENFMFLYEEDKNFDILLLDIEMGRMDGVTLAKQIRKENETIQIVFITGYSEYIAEGYEVAALHYLMKPVSREKLFEVLDRAREKISRNERCLNLELAGEMVRIPLHEILYLDVEKNYVTVHARKEYTVRRTLAEFESELDARFFRAGRAAIVNLEKIRRVTKTQINLCEGAVLPLPRGYYEAVNRAIIERT